MNFYGKKLVSVCFLMICVMLMHATCKKENTGVITDKIIDVAIVGGGVAGLSAALPVTENALTTVIFQGPCKRGQLDAQTPVGNWPGITFSSGAKILKNLAKQVERNGGIIIEDTITEINTTIRPFVLTTKSGNTYRAKTIIVATGSSPKILGIPGEHEYADQGIWYDLPEEGVDFTNKSIVVIGSGDDAIRKANAAVRHGAKKVTILVRGNSLKAALFRQKRVLAQNKIDVKYQATVAAVIGNDHTLSGIRITNAEGSSILQADAVIVAIGRSPNIKLVQNKVALDSNGFIQVKNRSQETSEPGIFAAGVIVSGDAAAYGQAAIMAAEGMKAAYDTIAYIDQQNKK